MEQLVELEEEFDSLMKAGLDEVAVGDTEIAEEYFSDAAYTVNQVRKLNEEKAKELENKYTVNPMDFAM